MPEARILSLWLRASQHKHWTDLHQSDSWAIFCFQKTQQHLPQGLERPAWQPAESRVRHDKASALQPIHAGACAVLLVHQQVPTDTCCLHKGMRGSRDAWFAFLPMLPR